MSQLRKKSRAICVLGMHRSGTSVISRAINLLGAYIGDENDLQKAGPENEKGFWERNDIKLFNERLLHHLNRRWYTFLPLSDKWQASKHIQPFKKELIELIKENFNGHALWTWKDPRNSIILPIWKDVLSELSIGLAAILIIRNPLSVAKSLEQRNGFSKGKSLRIWFNYNISALKSILDVPSILVDYDKLMMDWEQEMKRCSQVLNLPWPEKENALKEEIGAFISPDLCHYSSSKDDLISSGAPEQVINLYNLLNKYSGLASWNNANSRDEVEILFKDFSSYANFFNEDEVLVYKLSRELTECHRLLKEKNNKLQSATNQLQSIINSKSWRIIKYIRVINRFVKKKRR